MEYYLTTRDECKQLVENNNAFYVTETEVEGYKVEMYCYRLASITDFIQNKAFELRGLTFIYNPKTNKWERNLLLNKFFNVNQTDGWMFDDLKDKKIVNVQDKLDGSIISFVKFPNGVVRAKSKMSFTSEQAVMAQKIYDENENLRNMLEYSFSYDHTLVFELVSPANQIVLEYQDTKLVLLHIRDSDGQYFNETYKYLICQKFNIEQALKYTTDYHNLDILLALKEKEENIEGWVVTFEDGTKAKIKTNWYLQLHNLIGPDAFRENLLVQTILDNNIDDVISNLTPGIKKDKIIKLTEKVENHFNYLVNEFLKLRNLFFNEYKENRKEFALEFSKTHELFNAVIKSINKDINDIEKEASAKVKEHILKKCNSLNNAINYLKNIKDKNETI